MCCESKTGKVLLNNIVNFRMIKNIIKYTLSFDADVLRAIFFQNLILTKDNKIDFKKMNYSDNNIMNKNLK